MIEVGWFLLILLGIGLGICLMAAVAGPGALRGRVVCYPGQIWRVKNCGEVELLDRYGWVSPDKGSWRVRHITTRKTWAMTDRQLNKQGELIAEPGELSDEEAVRLLVLPGGKE